MGAVQSIPVCGEIATVVQSGTKLLAAGGCALAGKSEYAKQLVDGAKRSWVEYSETNLIAAAINYKMKRAKGNSIEATRIKNKCLGAFEDVIDGCPLIGHVKGVVHYAAGNREHGNKCMFNATRSTVVMGAGVLTGGVGGGTVAGGLSGLGAGIVHDVVASIVNKESTGTIQAIKEVAKTKDPNKFVDLGLALAGDFSSGCSGAKIGKAFRAKLQQRSLEKSYQQTKDSGNMTAEFDPKLATSDTIDAARNMEKHIKSGTVKNDAHVSTRVRNTETNNVSQGFNSRASADINQAKFQKQGTDSGFKSKTNAKTSAFRQTSELQRRQPDVKPVMSRNPASCAEHDAFNNYFKQPEASTATAQTVSVEYRDGSYSTTKRCPNCTQYDMGMVPTDTASEMPVPTECTIALATSGVLLAMLKKTETSEKGIKDELINFSEISLMLQDFALELEIHSGRLFSGNVTLP